MHAVPGPPQAPGILFLLKTGTVSPVLLLNYSFSASRILPMT